MAIWRVTIPVSFRYLTSDNTSEREVLLQIEHRLEENDIHIDQFTWDVREPVSAKLIRLDHGALDPHET